jgi:hypothetical protein
MSEQPIQDTNDGKSWSEMDLFDLRNSLAYGRSIEEVAGFLCRSGTVEEVRRKAEELGLLRSSYGWRGAVMDKDYLLLKPASASRPSGQWNDDDFDVLANGVVVGRIFKANASPVGASWMWTLAFGHHGDRTSTHGYAATREAAMAAFAKSWRRR